MLSILSDFIAAKLKSADYTNLNSSSLISDVLVFIIYTSDTVKAATIPSAFFGVSNYAKQFLPSHLVFIMFSFTKLKAFRLSKILSLVASI